MNDYEIVVRPRDLQIKTVNTKKGERELVQINWFLGTDESFIKECRSKGVQEAVPYEQEEETEDE